MNSNRSNRWRALVLAGAAALALAPGAPRAQGSTTVAGPADEYPSPALAPEQVVRIQLEALRSNDPGDSGIAVAFRFASPANRRSTGPLARFAAMIANGPYRIMLEYRQAAFEPVEVAGARARQRVTLVGATSARAFVFYLSRQADDGPCAGCWMTDAVMVEPVPGRPA